MTSIAIMQPYFIPYAGYFRLHAACDLLVLLDDVQYPRRGWVHRNRLRNHAGGVSWLSLPLAKGGRDTTRICDLHFRPQGSSEMRKQLRRFPLFAAPAADAAGLAEGIDDLSGDVVSYLHGQLDRTSEILRLPLVWARSSQFGIESGLLGWERLAAIIRRAGGDTYVNAPGGRSLYDPADFKRMGIRLRFLAPHDGPSESILQRLHDEGAARIRAEIDRNVRFCDD